MLEQCERWMELQNIQGECWDYIWNGFAAISKSLHERGWLDGPFALMHGDLLPYNLLVDVRGSKTVDISGILDWDSAIFAPKFMAYRAPLWLWLHADDGGDADEIEWNANLEPTTVRERELKQVFKNVASEEQTKFAFALEAMLARRLFQILKDGVFSSTAIEEAEAIIQEWKELHPEDKIPGDDEEDDPADLFDSDDEAEDE